MRVGIRRLGVRLVARAVVIMVLVAIATIGLARPAAADLCADAPDPLKPRSGLPGMMTSTPKHIPPKAPDPFKDPSVPIGQVYGYNWHWSNYDLGCGNDFLRDPAAVTNTQTANVILSQVGAAVAGLASLEQMSKSWSLDWLKNVTLGIAEKLSTPVLYVWLPLGLVGAGIIVGFRAKRSGYSDTMRTLLVVAVGVAVAVFGLVFPAKASTAVDRAVMAVSQATGAQFSTSPSDSINRESAYRTWLTGNFGDPDSAVATELGPRLMWATHYSWTEMRRMQNDADAKDEIDKAKAEEFKKVAKELEDRDPAAYDVFTGRGDRTGPAMFGIVVVLAMGLFVGLAMVMVLIARVMAQALAIAAPIAVVIGVLPTHTTVLSRLWDLFTAAILAVAKFVIAGGVMALVLGSIQTNQSMGAGAKLVWVVVTTVVGIVLTSPLRTFKTMVPGLDPDRSYMRSAINGLASYFGARLGDGPTPDTNDGNGAPRSQDGKGSTPNSTDGTARHSITAQESLPALPAPQRTAPTSSEVVHVQAPDASAPAGQNPVVQRTWPGVVATQSIDETARRQEVEASSPSPRSALDAQPANDDTTPPKAVPAGAVDHAPATEVGDTSRGPESDTAAPDSTSEPAPRLAIGAAPTAEHSPPRSETPTTDVPAASSPAAGDVEPESGTEERQDRPRSTSPAESGSEVVYPTGVIVAEEEPPLYRSSQAAPDRGHTYVPLAETDLAEDGTEHAMVTYHSGRGGGHASS